MKKQFGVARAAAWLARSVAIVVALIFGLTTAMPALAFVADGPPASVALGTTGTITVTKIATGGNGTFYFTGDNGIGNFSITTEESGPASHPISLLAFGTYSITEVGLPADWTQTSSDCGAITISAESPTATCTITNNLPPRPSYSISGRVYHDNSPQNGSYDSDTEEGLDGWDVYLDLNNNDTFDATDTSVPSAEGGLYQFTGLDEGCYTVREDLKNDWNQTDPTVDPDGVANDFEYRVSVGPGDSCNPPPPPPTIVSFIQNLFIHTAQAQALRTYNFGNIEQPHSGGGTRSGSSTTKRDDPGQVLGDTTTIPSQPLVLGATLPVTGSPTWVVLMLALLAAPMYYFRSLAVKRTNSKH